MAIDAAAKRESPASDGLFTVWRAFIARTAGNVTVTERDFLDSIASVGGAEPATAVQRTITAKSPNFGAL
jgi:hypothetical protein